MDRDLHRCRGPAPGSSESLDAGRPHPRTYGSTARVLGRYTRDRGILSLETAIAKLSSIPAERLGLRDRGMVREGAVADLVVFDAVTVADEATYTGPARYPIGIDDVFVNGRPVIVDGAETGERAGRLLRRADRPDVTATETDAVARLPGGPIAYTLRRSPRSRGLRVVIHPDRGDGRHRPTRHPTRLGEPRRTDQEFLAEREPWVRRHLAQQARDRATLAARGGLRDGATIRYRGDLHRLRVVPRDPASGGRRSNGSVVPDQDELIVHLSPSDRRSTAAVLEAWLKPRARAAIERDVARHATALGVSPAALSVRDQRTRWGSASRQGRLAFSWRLILAPPEALETVVIHELAHLRVFGHGPQVLGPGRLTPARSQGVAPVAARPFDGAPRRARRRGVVIASSRVVVEMRGLEPLTPAMRTQCSSS